MRVVNSHKRIINQPKENISKLFKTLGTDNDKVWPSRNWPAMLFKSGFIIGSKGGHGPIRYTIVDLTPGEHVRFKFTRPEGFNGTHEMRIKSISENQTEVSHLIQMNTTFKASFSWMLIVRWLHDALIEEAFDNIENYFSDLNKRTPYTIWVLLLRTYFKRKQTSKSS